VALARALAVQPDVLLLDEPLGALDLSLRRSMQDELKAIQRRVGTTFVHVTHDQEEAMAISDRIVVMNAGRIEDAGTAERLYRQPATLFTAGFLGEMNRLPVRRAGQGVESPFGPLALQAPQGAGALVLCLRPEALRTEPAEMPLSAAYLEDAAFFGTHVRARLRPVSAPDEVLVAHLPPGAVPPKGAMLDLWAHAADLMLFSED
jgi:spermidine/putrescine transport system ATP-binding protein